MAVVRLSAKMETSVAKEIARSTASAPRIAMPPTATGSAAANRPPNTQTNTKKLSGIAIDSINTRSCCDWSVICTLTIAIPPARTVTPSRSCVTCSDSSLAYFCWSLSLPLMPAMIRPAVRSLLIRSLAAGGGAVHGDVTLAT